MLAPESYTNAGSYGAYKYHALSVHPSIIDVVVLGPDLDDRIPPGQVWIYPLTKEGLPTQELLQLIENQLSSEKKRPINDKVIVKAPEIVEYNIIGQLTLYRGADITSTLGLSENAITDWKTVRELRLGLDIVPSQISKILSVSGVYDLTLNSPIKSIVKPYEWAVCTQIQISVAGLSDE